MDNDILQRFNSQLNHDSSTTIVMYAITLTRRVVKPWHNLPSETVDFSTLGKFIHSLQRVDISKYLTYHDD